MIAIINCQSGNLLSVKRAVNQQGLKACISENPSTIMKADKIIFPGVGQAKTAMQNLRKLKLIEPIKQYARSGKPFLGICLGAQILLDQSEEGNVKCLGIIPGKVKKFTGKKLVVPHMGWNQVAYKKTDRLFHGTPNNSFFYFVHSYYLEPDDKDVVIGITEYTGQFACVLKRGNVYAVQFHPEKSGEQGARLLSNFLLK